MKNEIKSRDALKDIVEEIKKREPESKIVTTNGCFDILHSGHLYIFERAKYLGKYLIVGINSEESVRKYKGSDRPINSENDRALLVAALKPVNYITIFNEDTPIEFFNLLKPDFHVKSKSGFTGIEKYK